MNKKSYQISYRNIFLLLNPILRPQSGEGVRTETQRDYVVWSLTPGRFNLDEQAFCQWSWPTLRLTSRLWFLCFYLSLSHFFVFFLMCGRHPPSHVIPPPSLLSMIVARRCFMLRVGFWEFYTDQYIHTSCPFLFFLHSFLFPTNHRLWCNRKTHCGMRASGS